MSFIARVLLLALALSVVPALSGLETASGARFEKTLFRLHNKDRKRRNLPRFRFTSSLRRAAKDYAKVMLANDHFSHTGPDGRSADQRIRTAGFTGTTTGENIAFGFTSPKAVFRGWMNSSGHRRNIRRRAFDQIGFGKADTYWVTNFGG